MVEVLSLVEAALSIRVVLVLRGAFVFFGWTVAALGSVGWGAAFVTSLSANRRATLCCDS